MNRFFLIVSLAFMVFVTSCAQLNADKKTPALEAAILENKDNYLNCMTAYATKYAEVTDSATILAEGAGSECSYLIVQVEDSMRALASIQYLSTSYQNKVAKEHAEELEKEARSKVIDMVVKARIGNF
jgi:hypothetical protein